MSIWWNALPLLTQILFVYFFSISLVAFCVFGYDKMRSTQKNAERISERTLWILTLLGGSIGSLIAMYLFRHKTRKLSFQAGMAIILMIQIALIIYYVQTSQTF